MSWFKRKPKAFGDAMIDMKFDRAKQLIEQSFRIDLPKLSTEERRVYRYKWGRDQVAQDARAYAKAGGLPNATRDMAVQGMIEAAFPRHSSHFARDSVRHRHKESPLDPAWALEKLTGCDHIGVFFRRRYCPMGPVC